MLRWPFHLRSPRTGREACTASSPEQAPPCWVRECSVGAMLQVTPNGPWGRDVHAAIPVSLDELVLDLRACFEVGATGVHLHVRDQSGAETLHPAIVGETCRRVRETAEEVGVSVEIGLTTGAWIVADLAERIAMIRE